MAGFSGAVEDGIRNTGMAVSLVLSLALGYAYRSVLIGVGAFVAGSLISIVWATHAGEEFRARQMAPREDPREGPQEGPGEGTQDDGTEDRSTAGPP